jgi:hypothetical protein
LNGARRSLLVNSLLVLLWLSFLFLWKLANRVTGISEVLASVGFLGGMIAVYGAVLAVWVYHNIRIWRQKGPRRGLRQISEEVGRDVLSRDILPTVDLKREQDIEVSVEGNYKVFTSAAKRVFTSGAKRPERVGA